MPALLVGCVGVRPHPGEVPSSLEELTTSPCCALNASPASRCPPPPFAELPLPSERVVGLEGVFVADVAAGGWHSMAISTEGGGRHLLAWLSSVFTPRTLRRARFGCVGETSGLASLDDRP